MKLLFFGSDDFALMSLQALLESDHRVVACATQPDRPKGRGLKLSPNVIKEFAVKNKIPVLQPDFLRGDKVIAELKNFEADLFVVIAYGKILPAEILSLPKIFCLNVHGSLLPKYRGAAPINWAIINGDHQTGVTVMKLNETMDAGDIINQQPVAINEDDTAISLRAKMAQVGVELLLRTLHSIENKNFKLIKQDLSQVSYAPKLSKELGVIRWSEKAKTIHDLVRGLLPWPSAHSYFNGKRLKILQTKIATSKSQGRPGEIADIQKEGILVSTASEHVLIQQVQPEDGKPMKAHAFAIGQRLKVGNTLG